MSATDLYGLKQSIVAKTAFSTTWS